VTRKLTPQEAAWKAALGYRARQQRTRRASRKPKPLQVGMLRVTPAATFRSGAEAEPAPPTSLTGQRRTRVGGRLVR
jgi:hypothetical protein